MPHRGIAYNIYGLIVCAAKLTGPPFLATALSVAALNGSETINTSVEGHVTLSAISWIQTSGNSYINSR